MRPHEEIIVEVREALENAFEPDWEDTVDVYEAYVNLYEQNSALRLVIAQQLTPLDVAATHIDILRRKNKEYEAGQVENVAIIVESHVKEARAALFASLS